MTELIEGEAVEVGMTVVEQQVERLDETATPEGMVALAARMATALADIVEKKRLYATIQGKKYPQVEAWMTIGRMDNVAAREVRGGVTRVEGGGFEAEVELIRLSDGMTVGYGSAMCGTPGDNPWTNRPVHTQRSMAVTRATSRAFRQRYSWIMALAGYEPTPADEMPDERGETHAPRVDDGQIGVASLGKIAPVDGNLRQTPDGMSVGFVIGEGRSKVQAVATGPRAEAFAQILPSIIGKRVQAYGPVSSESMTVRGSKVPFLRVALTKLVTPDETIDLSAREAPSMEAFDMDALDREQGAA